MEVDLRDAVKDLYGLIHARFINTARGMSIMVRRRGACRCGVLRVVAQTERYDAGEFGVCPRSFCDGERVLPVRACVRVCLHTPSRSRARLSVGGAE